MAAASQSTQQKEMLIFLPQQLISEDAVHAKQCAQIVKQFFVIKAGITVSHGDDMTTAEQGVVAMDEYNRWVKVMNQVYPSNKVAPFMKYTTGTKTKLLTGHSIMKKYKAGLEEFTNVYNPAWVKILQGQTSGDAPPDVWMKFLKKLFEERNKNLQRKKTFSVEKAEHLPWLLVYKHMGRPQPYFTAMTCVKKSRTQLGFRIGDPGLNNADFTSWAAYMLVSSSSAVGRRPPKKFAPAAKRI